MKRFTETQKWEDPWFRKLAPELKLLWHWLLDKCDGAGIIEPDIELASFQIGFAYPADVFSEFNGRVTKLKCGKYFIPKFIGYQYGNLSRDCKAHNPVFSSLEKHGLKGYPKGIHTLQDKEKDKDKETEAEKDNSQKAAKGERKAKPIDDKHLDQLQNEYPHAKVRDQFAACTKWWLEKKQTHPSRLALRNWLNKVQPPPSVEADLMARGLGNKCRPL